MKIKYILFLALFLGSFLRLYRLGDYPALNADEAAIGYNAYSLITSGLDEHGNGWPLSFQSFNDYKPGGYFYLTLPFVYVFGLNIWSVRIASALLGIFSIYLIYLFGGLINKTEKKIGSYEIGFGEVCALLLVVSPWHIHFSRGGWEVNAATFFMLFGVYLFLKYFKKEKLYYLILSAASFNIAIYTYHSARIIAPLLVAGVIVFNYKNSIKKWKNFLIAGAIGVLFILPLIYEVLFGQGVLARAGGVSIFSDRGIISGINEQRGEHENSSSLLTKLVHNKVVNYGVVFSKNWMSHYHGEFLFLSGDEIQRNRVPETGQMYMFDVILVILGIVYLIKVKEYTHKNLLFYWLLVAPFAAALTFQSPHALRAHNMVIPLILIASVGLFELLKHRKYVWLVIIILVWGFARYQIMYWLHMSKEYPYSSQYGVEGLVDYVSSIKEEYDDIIVTDRYDQPYILFLFYEKYSPEKFQNNHVLTAPDGFGFSTVREYDNYKFISIDFESVKEIYPNSLIIGTDEEIPDSANIIHEIYFPSGEVAFQIVEI